MVDVAAAWVRDRCTCLYCGRTSTDPLVIQLVLTVDHFYPQGGKDQKRRVGGAPTCRTMSPADIHHHHNIKTACRMCNSIKRNYVFDTIKEAWLYIRLMHQNKIDWHKHFIEQRGDKRSWKPDKQIKAIRQEFLIERDFLYRFVMGMG
jgi:hypothetical protein